MGLRWPCFRNYQQQTIPHYRYRGDRGHNAAYRDRRRPLGRRQGREQHGQDEDNNGDPEVPLRLVYNIARHCNMMYNICAKKMFFLIVDIVVDNVVNIVVNVTTAWGGIRGRRPVYVE